MNSFAIINPFILRLTSVGNDRNTNFRTINVSKAEHDKQLMTRDSTSNINRNIKFIRVENNNNAVTKCDNPAGAEDDVAAETKKENSVRAENQINAGITDGIENNNAAETENEHSA